MTYSCVSAALGFAPVGFGVLLVMLTPPEPHSTAVTDGALFEGLPVRSIDTPIWPELAALPGSVLLGRFFSKQKITTTHVN